MLVEPAGIENAGVNPNTAVPAAEQVILSVADASGWLSTSVHLLLAVPVHVPVIATSLAGFLVSVATRLGQRMSQCQ
jgi:hypothetical protein